MRRMIRLPQLGRIVFDAIGPRVLVLGRSITYDAGARVKLTHRLRVDRQRHLNARLFLGLDRFLWLVSVRHLCQVQHEIARSVLGHARLV